jgi:hypothetical protein
VALENRFRYGIRRNAMEAISTEVEKRLPTFAKIWPLIANSGIHTLRECSDQICALSVNPKHNFPKLLAPFQSLVSLLRVLNRHHRIDHRLYKSASHHIKHRVEFRLASHVRAKN